MLLEPMYIKEDNMWQIKVNGILMPEIFYSLRAAMEACQREKARGCATFTEIIMVQST